MIIRSGPYRIFFSHEPNEPAHIHVDRDNLLANEVGRRRVPVSMLPPLAQDADVQDYLTAIAAKKGMPLSQLANDLLKREIGIIEAVK